MDSIRQALERTLRRKGDTSRQGTQATSHFGQDVHDMGGFVGVGREITLDRARLESNRIIGHDDTDPRARPFDMLRTQVLQAMDQKNWSILGITSPTAGCGKTVMATNLAFSIARQPDRSALLVDLDLHKPQVASYLGLKKAAHGTVSILEGRADLPAAIVSARTGNRHIRVLPAERTAADSSALVASRAMSDMLQEMRRDYRSCTVILDLPPMLVSDDVLTILPQLDCILLVAAVGTSTIGQIEECNRHLQSTAVLRVVLNKVPEHDVRYYYSYPSPSTR
jgi:protein-tyrosine kinase